MKISVTLEPTNLGWRIVAPDKFTWNRLKEAIELIMKKEKLDGKVVLEDD